MLTRDVGKRKFFGVVKVEAGKQWLKEGVLKERKNGGGQASADNLVEFGHKKRARDWAGRGIPLPGIAGVQQRLFKMGGC